jgi:2-oxo-4-hydroxy-4-carboxy-5-ureidoimidazoline decarboxylase
MTPVGAGVEHQMESESAGLAAFEALSDSDAVVAAASCCPWEPFAARLVAGRPYRSPADMADAAVALVDAIPDAELPAVLSRFPQIGVDSGLATRAATWSRQEEAGVHGAADARRRALVELGTAYALRFGFTYVVAAAGKDAAAITADLTERMGNDRDQEMQVARGHIRVICRNRVLKLLAEPVTAR